MILLIGSDSNHLKITPENQEFINFEVVGGLDGTSNPRPPA